MKKKLVIIVVVSWVAVSCSAGKGCPSNGRNVGAEKLLSGDKQTMKDVRRAGKFRH